MSQDIEDIRSEYSDRILAVDKMCEDAMVEFRRWFDYATAHSRRDLSNAMTLATADGSGMPSARVVLLKHVDEAGFVFYTNYNSRKGRELDDNPRAALVFWWPALERQIRVQGGVVRVSGETSDRYFASRPRGSQLSSWASDQSRPIKDRKVLVDRLRMFEQRFEGRHVPRPEHWGGLRLRPSTIEFWKGQPDRLHDRILYERKEEGWVRRRLAP